MSHKLENQLFPKVCVATELDWDHVKTINQFEVT